MSRYYLKRGFSLWLRKSPKIKSILKVFCWKHLYIFPTGGIPKACFKASGPRGIFLFHFHPLGMQFHTINPPPTSAPSSHQPWPINISMSQSIFIIKHMPNPVCGCEDTGLLFIHLIYLYFFPEGETLVSIHLCWLLAITEHLELLLNWPEGNRILERSTCFRAKRCVCCVCFCREGAEFSVEQLQHTYATSTKKATYVRNGMF